MIGVEIVFSITLIIEMPSSKMLQLVSKTLDSPMTRVLFNR